MDSTDQDCDWKSQTGSVNPLNTGPEQGPTCTVGSKAFTIRQKTITQKKQNTSDDTPCDIDENI